MIRTATAADAPQVQALYAAWNYRGRVEPDDAVVVAEHEGRIIGVVRLAPEHGTTVLRGMRVEPAYQHQGLGSRMLAELDARLGAGECYCIAYAHLVGFYGQIGFAERAPEAGPRFLAERLASYRTRLSDGAYTLLHRPGRQPRTRRSPPYNRGSPAPN